MHLIVLIFGFTGILGELISLNSVPLVFYRTAIAAVVLAIFVGVAGKMQRLTSSQVLKLVAIGIITAAHWVFFFEAIKVSTISVAVATLASTALFISFLEPAFMRKRIDWREVVLGVVVIIGLVIIFQFETEYKLGIVLAIISAILAALFSVFNGIMIKEIDAVSISLYEMGAAAVGVFIFLLFTGGISTEFFVISNMDWLWLLLLGTIATAFAFVVSVDVMKVLSPFTVALSINMEPVYSILLALLIFGEKERMSTGFYAGAFIILAALFVDAWIKKAQRKKESASLLDQE